MIRKSRNHYVAQFYLKNWSDENRRLWCYRLLVSNGNISNWKRVTPRGIAYHRDLYTRSSEAIVDSLETLFDTQFENPAYDPIQRVINDDRLTPDDWFRLIRFFALQDVRTPASLMSHLSRTREMLPEVMDGVLQDAKQALESGGLHKGIANNRGRDEGQFFPMKLVRQPDEDPEKIKIGIVATPGRASWLHSIDHVLKNAAKELHKHRWTIVKPAKGYHWPTSDDPVVKLNYYKPGEYDFGGGYAWKGSELLLPLSPEHLMYTMVGSKPPERGSRFDPAITKAIQRFIVESAHRMVFSAQPDEHLSGIRDRIVDDKAVKNEKRQWEHWHREQSEVEARYFSKSKKLGAALGAEQ